MENHILNGFLLVGGFLLLAKGADWLVGGSSELARRWGVSTLVVGLTVIAWGTSAPEVVVSGLAAAEGKPGIALGNVLGSNVANIGLVLGACAVVLPAVLHTTLALRDSFWLLAALGCAWWALSDAALTRVEGVLLLGAFLAYNVHLFLTTSRGGDAVGDPGGHPHPWRNVILGTLGVSIGAKLTVIGAENVAAALGISHRVIGLTVVAIGTSLPELAAGLGGALKGHSDISVGNVVGSNVFNVLAVFGVVGIVAPFVGTSGDTLAALERAQAVDLPVVLGFSLAAIALPWVGGPRHGRWKGLLLLAGYVVYVRGLFS